MSLLIMLKRNFIYLLLIILAILPRFIFLNNVPNAINQDELHYALDAKSFFLTGKDVLGKTSSVDVLLFRSPQSEPVQAELAYFLEAPVLGFMGFSLLSLIFPNAILGVLTVVLIYLIARKLFDENTALIAGLIAAINPWLIFLSRSTYEAGPATLFFLCVFYVLLVTKGWKILLTIPVALLAFYSYIGTKLIFLPFMLLGISYAYLYVNKRKYLKQYILLFASSCLLMFFFLFQLKSYGTSSRGPELLMSSNPKIIERVNDFRKASLQSPFLAIFENKYSVYGSVLAKSTFNIFSPTYLFANADYFFMMSGHGLFYYIDLIFLIAGSVWALVYRRKIFYFFSAFISVSILPQILHESSLDGNFTPHVALIIPFFIILIAVGIYRIINLSKHKKYAYLSLAGIGIIYLALFLNFSYFYFLKFPLQEGTFEAQSRILSKYVSLSGNDSPITVFSANPKLVFREYIFYENRYNEKTANVINNALKQNNFVLNNVSFFPCNYTGLKNTTGLIISDVYCAQEFSKKSISIAQLRDSGKRYNIFNDKVCNQFNLPKYISNLKLSDFNIENLTSKKFCETFIVSY